MLNTQVQTHKVTPEGHQIENTGSFKRGETQKTGS